MLNPVNLRNHFRWIGLSIAILSVMLLTPMFVPLLGTSHSTLGQAVSVSKVAFLSFDDDPKGEVHLQAELKRLEGLTVEQLQKEFKSAMDLWRQNFAKLAHGQTAFYHQPESESGKWAAQFRAARRAGEAARKQAGLVGVELASRIDGELDQDLATIVYYSMDEYLVFEKYHLAYKAGKGLVDSGIRVGHLLAMLGYASYCTNRFEEAQEYFSEAIVAGAELPPQYSAVNLILKDSIEILKKENEVAAAESDNPIAKIETTKGTIVIELLEDQAPNTVANFINLAEAKFYDGQEFYDTHENYLTTGSPTNEASGNAGYAIKNEADSENRRPHLRGYLTLMVIPETGLGSSQFSILTQPMTEMRDTDNTVFARVIEGDWVLDDINRVGEEWREFAKKSKQPLDAPDRIISVKIENKRDHEYVVKKYGT